MQMATLLTVHVIVQMGRHCYLHFVIMHVKKATEILVKSAQEASVNVEDNRDSGNAW